MPSPKKKGRQRSKSGKGSEHSPSHDSDKRPVSKSEDKSKLEAYLSDVLEDERKQKRDSTRLSDEVSTSDESMGTYLKTALEGRISDLSGAEKIDLMMRFAGSSLILSEGFNDRLVDKARELIPSLAYRTIATAIVQEGGRGIRDKENQCPVHSTAEVSDSCEALLRNISGHGKHNGQKAMADARWCDFLSSCEAEDQVYVFRQLLRLGYGDFKKFSLGVRDPGDAKFRVESVLRSKHTVRPMALLLMDEVAQSRDKPGSFFHSTELGSLLALSTMPSIDRKRREFRLDQEVKSVLIALSQRVPHPPVSVEVRVERKLTVISENCLQINEAIGTALQNVLLSDNATFQHSVLTWAATVLNKNKVRRKIILSVDYDDEDGSSDAYMMNFCRILFRWLESFGKKHSRLVDFSYFTSAACRLNLGGERFLNGRPTPLPLDPQGDRGVSPKLSSSELKQEVWCLCHRAVGVCFLPTICRYECLKHSVSPRLEITSNSRHFLGEVLTNLYFKAVWERTVQHSVAAFYGAQCKWFQTQLSPKESEDVRQSQQKVFSEIPEFCLTDMADWVNAVCHTGKRQEITFPKGFSFDLVIDLCIRLLQRPDLLGNPHADTVLAYVLHALVSDEVEGTSTKKVLSKVKDHLGPALLRAYVDQSGTYGFPPDRHCFFGHRPRFYIISLIMEILSCKDLNSVLSQEKTNVPDEFLLGVLNEVLHSYHNMELSKKVVALTEASVQVSVDRDSVECTTQNRNNSIAFARIFSKSFEIHMMALQALATIEAVAQRFTRHPLSYLAATVALWLISDFSISDKNEADSTVFSDLNKRLDGLAQVVPIFLLNIVRKDSKKSDGFVSCLVEHSGLCLENLNSRKMKEAIMRLGEERCAELEQTLRDLTSLHSRKRAALLEESVPWTVHCLQVSVDEETLLNTYRQKLHQLRLTRVNLKDSHSFKAVLKNDEAGAARVAVLREMGYLQERLPFNLSSAVFLAVDKERMDVLRCLISGPVGTPYSRGVFVFDIYCPELYPGVAPLVRFLTTGFGMADFSLHLENDGKVSLSLLQTNPLIDSSGQWSSTRHTILNVLSEIKRLIFVRIPSQRSGENDTTTEETTCCSENMEAWEIQAMTVRHAMLEALRFPPAGLEDVVRLHFAVQREAILKQCAMWIQNCEDEKIATGLKWDVQLLYRELQALQTSAASSSGGLQL